MANGLKYLTVRLDPLTEDEISSWNKNGPTTNNDDCQTRIEKLRKKVKKYENRMSNDFNVNLNEPVTEEELVSDDEDFAFAARAKRSLKRELKEMKKTEKKKRRNEQKLEKLEKRMQRNQEGAVENTVPQETNLEGAQVEDSRRFLYTNQPFKRTNSCDIGEESDTTPLFGVPAQTLMDADVSITMEEKSLLNAHDPDESATVVQTDDSSEKRFNLGLRERMSQALSQSQSKSRTVVPKLTIAPAVDSSRQQHDLPLGDIYRGTPHPDCSIEWNEESLTSQKLNRHSSEHIQTKEPLPATGAESPNASIEEALEGCRSNLLDAFSSSNVIQRQQSSDPVQSRTGSTEPPTIDEADDTGFEKTRVPITESEEICLTQPGIHLISEDPKEKIEEGEIIEEENAFSKQEMYQQPAQNPYPAATEETPKRMRNSCGGYIKVSKTKNPLDPGSPKQSNTNMFMPHKQAKRGNIRSHLARNEPTQKKARLMDGAQPELGNHTPMGVIHSYGNQKGHGQQVSTNQQPAGCHQSKPPPRHQMTSLIKNARRMATCETNRQRQVPVRGGEH